MLVTRMLCIDAIITTILILWNIQYFLISKHTKIGNFFGIVMTVSSLTF
jgi:hypothetical protein